VLIKVIYDSMGFSENPQNYVKDVVKYAILEEWKYPSYSTQPSLEVDFSHFVTVQFVDIQASGEDENGLISKVGLRLSKDLFYPAFIRALSAVTAAVSVASLMTFSLLI
jgi:hypothetical protein